HRDILGHQLTDFHGLSSRPVRSEYLENGEGWGVVRKTAETLSQAKLQGKEKGAGCERLLRRKFKAPQAWKMLGLPAATSHFLSHLLPAIATEMRVIIGGRGAYEIRLACSLLAFAFAFGRRFRRK